MVCRVEGNSPPPPKSWIIKGGTLAELIEVVLEDDEIKIDGNMAIAWSSGLKFTVERAGTSLAGSAVSGEGLVNVYRGTGRILLMPVAK